MYNAASINEMIHASKHFCYSGVQEGSSFDWKGLQTLRNNYIKRLHGIYLKNLQGNGVQQISVYIDVEREIGFFLF
jgi:glutathione reductase (NADPH)